MSETPEMTKAERRAQRRAAKAESQRSNHVLDLKPRTETQGFYLRCLREDTQIFGVGPAGTGKTYLAARHAMSRLKRHEIERIIVSRPTVSPSRHRMGFLPGNAAAKQRPWLKPIFDAFKDEVTPAVLDRMTQAGQVEVCPFEHMRGLSFHNAVVILDEAQNCDLRDLKLFLTRVGENSQVVICGDLDQTDMPEDSGLRVVIDLIDRYEWIDASICEFGEDDVVRSEAAKQWVKAFTRAGL